jgi:hypothetical protein
MISRADIRELADFQVDGKQEYALSFYFQPQLSRDKSHREDEIIARDVARKAEREIKHNGNHAARADLQRILEIAEDLRAANTPHAKAVFACGSRNFWREYDLPSILSGTAFSRGRRFHLKPLLMTLERDSETCVVVLDRKRARIFDLSDGGIVEREGRFHSLSRRGRGDGWHGYDGGHSERSLDDEVLHHFRDVATHLKGEAEKGMWQKWIAGCLDINWRDFEAQLHPDLKKRFLGWFPAVAEMNADQVRETAEGITRTTRTEHNHELVKRVLNYAKSHRRGVTGLRRVLRSLELGEVQSLLLSANYSAHAVECTACGRLDAHLVRYCASCGHSTRRLEDICEAMIPLIVRRDIELVCVENGELESVGNIAALLRFHSRAHLAEAS